MKQNKREARRWGRAVKALAATTEPGEVYSTKGLVAYRLEGEDTLQISPRGLSMNDRAKLYKAAGLPFDRAEEARLSVYYEPRWAAARGYK